MLILHAAESYPPLISGIPRVASQLSERMARQGHEVHVATGAVAGAPAEEVLNGVHVHRFAVSGNRHTGIRGDVRPYLEFLDSRPWDAMAAHCSQVWSTDLLFEHPMDCPIVFVAHGLSAYNDPSWHSYFVELANWLSKGKTMVSLASSGIEDSRFREEFLLPDSEIIAVGVDPVEWELPPIGVRKSWGWAERPWLLNVSAHSPAKAHHRLFELAERLADQSPAPQITQIGRSHPAHRWNLGKLGVQGGCYYSCMRRSFRAKNINLMLHVSRRDELVSAVQEADVFVLCSEWEASPAVILESMAAGTPFVTLDVGAVRQNVGGFVVEDMDEMQVRILQLLADKELRQDLGRQGRERIRQRHDWEVIAGQYLDLYRRLATIFPYDAARK